MPTGKHLEVNILLNFPGVWKAWFIMEAHRSTQAVIINYINLTTTNVYATYAHGSDD